jgi:formylglycine-generating enzyme required for sulfatase activity
MGSNQKEEKPIHEVQITHPFCLGQSEVTEWQWRQVMVDPNSPRQDKDDRPVTATWNDAQVFIKKLNELAGEQLYRLPREAEWEYAARADSPARYSFGDDSSLLEQYGNYLDNSSRSLAPVCSFKRNPWGLCDMYGNVWEWVEDYYGPYSEGAAIDPQGPAQGERRMRRGGSFNSRSESCRSATRSHWPPDRRSKENGFRIVKVLM